MFRTKPIVEWAKADLFIVRAPLIWAERADSADAIVVPDGFPTDLASVPRILRNLKGFDQNGPSFPAAILHDFLYATGMGGKAYADQTFHRALIATGMSRPLAWMYFKGVDLFGFGPYGDHTARRAMAAAAGRPYPALVPRI
jgi:hypothetical protein